MEFIDVNIMNAFFTLVGEVYISQHYVLVNLVVCRGGSYPKLGDVCLISGSVVFTFPTSS